MLASLFLLGAISMNDSVQAESYHPIVIDAETRMRIKDARVIVDGSEMKTSWDGSFTVTKPYKKITIRKGGYLTRNMDSEEREDTIVLVNNGHKLNEVVVIGHRPEPQIKLKINDPNELPQKMNSGGLGVGFSFDFFKALDYLVNYKKHKRHEKVLKILHDYSANEQASQTPAPSK